MGQVVHRVGFVSHDTLAAGCSPDGLTRDGVVEVKAPSALRHLDYLRVGRLPPTYRTQVLHLLWIMGADWLDFVSFDPRFPQAWQLCCVRVHRDDTAIAAYARHARLFLDEVERDLDGARTARDLRGVLRQVVAGGVR
jgi:hypothetical protein